MCSIPVLTIHGNNLLNWLINRNLINPDWNSTFVNIKPQIDLACRSIYEMPEFIQYRDHTNYINYFTAEDILQSLADHQKDDDTVSQWKEVVNRLKGVYLAQSAYVYVNISKWGIKSIRQNIAKIDSRISTSQQKSLKSAHNSTSLQEKLDKELLRLNFSLSDESDPTTCISEAVLNYSNGAYNKLLDICRSFKQIKQPLEYYYDFCEEVCARHSHRLPLVDFILVSDCELTVSKLRDYKSCHNADKIEKFLEITGDLVLIESTAFRNSLMTELLLLREFFLSRIADRNDQSSSIVTTINADQDVTLNSLEIFAERLQNSIHVLESVELRELISLRQEYENLSKYLININEDARCESDKHKFECLQVEEMKISRDHLERSLVDLSVIRERLHKHLEDEISRLCDTRVKIKESCFDL